MKKCRKQKIVLLNICLFVLVMLLSCSVNSDIDNSKNVQISDYTLYTWMEPNDNDSLVIKSIQGCFIQNLFVDKDSLSINYNEKYNHYYTGTVIENSSPNCIKSDSLIDTVYINYGDSPLTNIIPYSNSKIDSIAIQDTFDTIWINQCTEKYIGSIKGYYLTSIGLPNEIEISNIPINVTCSQVQDSLLRLATENDSIEVYSLMSSHMLSSYKIFKGCMVRRGISVRCVMNNDPYLYNATVPAAPLNYVQSFKFYAIDSIITNQKISWTLILSDRYNRKKAINILSTVIAE